MILSVEGVSISFGGVQALSGVSMEIEQGMVRGLIGPNGSGKTSLFNVISGFYTPSSGSVLFNEKNITPDSPSSRARKGMSRTFQGTILFEERTVFENILIATYARQKWSWANCFLPRNVIVRHETRNVEKAYEVLELIKLEKYRDEKVKNVPFGIRHFLEIGRCLAMEPSLLLLDEPTTGLNPAEQSEIIELIGKLKARGMSVLIVEHNMKVVMNACDRITVIDMGKFLAEGTVQEIRNDPNVIKSYLGKRGHAC
ncbi:ABC transporter ATP-binding protein [Propionivibrio sp.]|uniref:ABC transporter ATP-binding protein n=1 Tax=Propionivibrio sp. TaxID=2212460 RepID=UPI0039E5410E